MSRSDSRPSEFTFHSIPCALTVTREAYLPFRSLQSCQLLYIDPLNQTLGLSWQSHALRIRLQGSPSRLTSSESSWNALFGGVLMFTFDKRDHLSAEASRNERSHSLACFADACCPKSVSSTSTGPPSPAICRFGSMFKC